MFKTPFVRSDSEQTQKTVNKLELLSKKISNKTKSSRIIKATIDEVLQKFEDLGITPNLEKNITLTRDLTSEDIRSVFRGNRPDSMLQRGHAQKAGNTRRATSDLPNQQDESWLDRKTGENDDPSIGGRRK